MKQRSLACKALVISMALFCAYVQLSPAIDFDYVSINGCEHYVGAAQPHQTGRIVLPALLNAQNSGYSQGSTDYITAIKIFYTDGTVSQLLCSANGECVPRENNAAAPVIQMNMGFSSRRAAVLKVVR